MNTPNFLTTLRVLLAFLTAVLLCAPFRFAATAAFIVYCAAGATDWFDGYLARRRNIVTTFGKFMDALSDKIMVSTAFLTLFALGMFGGWTGLALFCAVISMSREFFVSGVRMLAASKGIVLAAERMARYYATSFLCFVAHRQARTKTALEDIRLLQCSLPLRTFQ